MDYKLILELGNYILFPLIAWGVVHLKKAFAASINTKLTSVLPAILQANLSIYIAQSGISKTIANEVIAQINGTYVKSKDQRMVEEFRVEQQRIINETFRRDIDRIERLLTTAAAK